MRVALHDSDRTRFPNLPLMKLSAWHRAQGDTVERFIALANDSYDRVYSSKVFSFTAEEPNLPRGVIRGGTGYGPGPDLPDEIEHIMPDYSLYPAFQASLGFVTRGCIRTCPWCVVPGKEGKIHAAYGATRQSPFAIGRPAQMRRRPQIQGDRQRHGPQRHAMDWGAH